MSTPAIESCESCKIKKVCRPGKEAETRQLELIAKNADSLNVGEKVFLKNSEGRMILSSILLFLVPLLVLIFMLVILRGVFNEGVRLLLGFTALSVYFVLLWILEKKVISIVHLEKIEKGCSLN